MRKLTIGFLVFASLVAVAIAQQVPANPVTTQQITLPVFTLNPAPASGATIALSGNPGPQTIYYWISANYLVGSANLAGPFPISNAPNVLSVSNFVTINPTFPAFPASYDVLKTSTPIAPSGACACAVATGVAPGTVTNDQSNSTSPYTVNPVNLSGLNMTLQNEGQSAGVSHLILRQNGVFVRDLSITGTLTTFSAGTLSPLFTTNVATPTTTPALSFVLSNAPANSVFANLTGSPAPPSYTTTQGTDTAVLSADGSGGTGNVFCRDATGGATTVGCSNTVSSFSAGTLSPLFTTSVATPTTTPALSFLLSNAPANSVFANLTGSPGAPSYSTTQGTDPAVLTAGTIGSGISLPLCTDANHGATTSGCLTAASGSLTIGSTIIEWGTIGTFSTGSSTASLTASFPLTFPTAVFTITGSLDAATDASGNQWGWATFNTLSTHVFTVTISAQAGAIINDPVNVRWIAIGD